MYWRWEKLRGDVETVGTWEHVLNANLEIKRAVQTKEWFGISTILSFQRLANRRTTEILSQNMMWKLTDEVTVILPNSTQGCYFYYQHRKSAYNSRQPNVLIYGMLDTSQIITPFNPLSSQNVSHNYDHATFNVDCCYDILQHLLHICMSTKASVKFHAIRRPHRQTIEIFYYC